MATLVLLNNFMHDFSAAGWIFGSVLLFTVLKSLPENIESTNDETLHHLVFRTLKTIRMLMVLSFLGIVVFGIVRATAYKQYEWSMAAGDAQITLLIVKHIILTVVFAGGMYYYIKAGKLIKINN